MSKTFVKIQGTRIKAITIQKYLLQTPLKLVIYYSVSRYKVQNEIFTFQTEEEAQIALNILDWYFLGFVCEQFIESKNVTFMVSGKVLSSALQKMDKAEKHAKNT